MASLAPNLTIKLNLDAAGLNKGFNAIKGAATGLSKSIKGTSKDVSGLDHALESLGVPGGMKGLEKHMDDLEKGTKETEKEVKSLKQKLAGGWKAGLSGVRNGLKGMGKDADNAGSKVDGLKNKLGGVWRISGGIILFNIIRKITRALKDFISTVFDFDTAMHNVNSVAQLTDTQFDALNSQVLKLALDPRIKDGPAQLAAGLYEVVSAGYSAAEGLQLLQVGAIAATAGMTSTETATGVLIATLGAYNLGVDHAQEISDKLFQIVNISKYTFEDLAASLDSVTPTAAALGITIDEVGAAMATMGAKGVDAQTATVQMNAILTALLKPTDAMTAKLHEMGYESGYAMVQQEGFVKTMQIWNDVLDGSEDKAADYFGDVRALRGLFNLTNDDVVALTANLKLMGEATDGVGATQKALAEQMKASSFQADIFKKNLQIIGIMVLSGLLPYLNKALNFVNSFIVNMITQFDHFRALGLSKWLSFKLALFKVLESIFGTENAQKVNNFITKLEGYFNTLKDIAMFLWGILKPVLEFMWHHFNIIGPAIIGAVVALKLLAAALMIVEVVAAVLAFELTPVMLVLIAVAAVGALFAVAWYNDWGGIQEKTHAAISFITKWLGKLIDFIQPVIDIVVLLGEYFHDVFTHDIEPGNLAKLPKWIQPIALVFGRVVKALRVFIVTWQKLGALAAFKTIPTQLRAFGRAMSKFLDSIGLKNFAKAYKVYFDQVAKVVGDIINLIDDLVHGRWSQAWKDLKKIAVDYVILLWTALKAYFGLLKDTFNILWEALKNVDWGKLLDGAKDLAGKLLGKLGDLAGDIWNWIQGAIPSKDDWLTLISLAYDIAQIAVDKLGNLGDKVLHWIIDHIPGADDWLRLSDNALDIASKVVGKFGNLLQAIGTWIAQNAPGKEVWLGIAIHAYDITSDIVERLGDLTGAITDWVGSVNWTGIFAPVKGIFEKLSGAITGVQTTIDVVGSTIGTSVQVVRDAFDILDDVVSAILDPIQKSIDAIQSGIGLIKTGLDKLPIVGGDNKPKDDSGTTDTGSGLSITDILNVQSAMGAALSEIQKNRGLITTEFTLLREDITYTQNKFIELPGTIATQMVQAYMNVHTNILGMETRLGNLWDKLKDVGTKGGEDFNTNLSNGLQMATTSHDLFMDAMETRAGEFVTNMGAFATSAGDAVNTNLSMGMQKATTSNDLYMDAMEIRAGQFVTNMGAFGTSAGNSFGNNLSNALYGASMYNAGQSIMNSLWSGMSSVWFNITYWLSGLDPAAYKGPPSRDKTLLLNAGKLIMGGLGDGLDQGWQDIKRQLSGYTPFITSNAAMPSASLPLPVGPQSNGPRVRGGRGDLYLTVKVEGNVYGVDDMTEAVSKEMAPVLAETWRDVRKSLGMPA